MEEIELILYLNLELIFYNLVKKDVNFSRSENQV